MMTMEEIALFNVGVDTCLQLFLIWAVLRFIGGQK